MNHPITSLTDSRFILPGDRRVSCRLYNVEEKLLVTSASFIGLQPWMIPLPFPVTGKGEEKSQDIDITHEGQSYNLQLTTALLSGPLRGCHRLKVTCNNTSLLQYEWGGAHGGNYTKGNSGFINEAQAALYLPSPELARFYEEQGTHFLLLFSDIVVPQQRKERDPAFAGTSAVKWEGKIRSGDNWIHVRNITTRRYASGYSVKEGGVLEDRQRSSVHTEEEVVLGNEFLEET